MLIEAKEILEQQAIDYERKLISDATEKTIGLAEIQQSLPHGDLVEKIFHLAIDSFCTAEHRVFYTKHNLIRKDKFITELRKLLQQRRLTIDEQELEWLANKIKWLENGKKDHYWPEENVDHLIDLEYFRKIMKVVEKI